MCIQNWAKRGIIFIKDLLDQNGNFQKFEILKKQYDIRGTILDYEEVKHNIPDIWTSKFKNIGNTIMVPAVPKHIKQIRSKNKKAAYNSIIERKINIQHSSMKKWDNVIHEEINWTQVYKNAITATQSTYLRSFHYKAIYNVICTNITLFKMKVKEDDTCSFCHTEKETTIHLFTECPHVTRFWDEVQKWFQSETGDQINLQRKHILFGGHPGNRLQNLIILTAKSHIYQCRLRDQIPCMRFYQNQLWTVYTAERYKAYISNKQNAFLFKWSNLISFFQKVNQTKAKQTT